MDIKMKGRKVYTKNVEISMQKKENNENEIQTN